MGGEISGRKCAWSFSHAGFTMHLQVTHFLNVRHVEERERERERGLVVFRQLAGYLVGQYVCEAHLTITYSQHKNSEILTLNSNYFGFWLKMS